MNTTYSRKKWECKQKHGMKIGDLLIHPNTNTYTFYFTLLHIHEVWKHVWQIRVFSLVQFNQNMLGISALCDTVEDIESDSEQDHEK